MTIEKGKTANGYAKNELKDSPNLVGGGYLTFFASAIRNTIVKNIILNMYFPITTTSSPDYISTGIRWHNRPAFTLF